MTYHQYHFDRVEDYLHHRPPYLLIDEIRSIEDERVVTETTLRGDAFFLTGHFPGAPILPGAMMQEMTTQSAGILIAARYNPMESFHTHDPFFNQYALGVLVKVKRARYRGFARPGDVLRIESSLVETVGDIFEFAGKIIVDGKTITDNRFQLTNIPSSVLRGEQPADG
jgi:3-hydroxyacyl-[acyl-carrier-protein] dehydratase